MKAIVNAAKESAEPEMPDLADVPPAMLERYFQKLFQVADANGDGVLQPEELARLLELSGFNFSGAEVNELVDAADVNMDGVIDYDELKTGQRKEGAYFAAWNFVYKLATGITLILTGIVLEAAGFAPNQAQTESAQTALRVLYALFPLTCYLVGAALLTRFRLDEREHARIRRELDAR